jgi:phosphoribosyl-ATP pyrophosphohydrolase
MKLNWQRVIDKTIAQYSTNIQKWGIEDISHLLICTIEELGEVARAYQDKDEKEFVTEVIQTIALLYQMLLNRDIGKELYEEINRKIKKTDGDRITESPAAEKDKNL